MTNTSALQHFSTIPKPSQHTPNRPTLPDRSQNAYTAYDYNNDIPKDLWHIGTSGAILIWCAPCAPQIPSATASFARYSREVVTGVDDLTAIAVEHQLLQRHRESGLLVGLRDRLKLVLVVCPANN